MNNVALLATMALCLSGTPITGAQEKTESQPATGAGRVVATVTALEGTVRVTGVEVELRSLDRDIVLARTLADSAGQVVFADVPAGRYVLNATRPGFDPTHTPPFDVEAGRTEQVLLEISLAFVEPAVEVRAPAAATYSVQPVSSSDMLSGSVLEIAPLEGDDFKSLLPLLPG